MHPDTTPKAPQRWLGLLALVAAMSACANGGSTASTGQEPDATAGLVRFRRQQTYDYAFTLSSKLSMSAASEVDVTLRAKLSVTPLPRVSLLPAGTDALRVVLRDVDLSSLHAEPGAFADLTRELQAGFIAEVRAGEVTRVLMTKPSLFAGTLARSIAAELALGSAPAPGAQRWEAAGMDAAGKYVSEYRTADGAVRLRKLRYEPHSLGKVPGASNELSLTPQVVTSQGEARIVSGELQRLAYTESLTTALLTSGSARAETQVSLELLERRATPKDAPGYAQLRAGMVDVAAEQATAARADAGTFDASKIAGYTFASASQRLAELTQGTPLILDGAASEQESAQAKAAREQRVSEFNRVFSALTAILRADASQIEACVQAIRSDSARAPFLIDALAGAGSERAQAALIALSEAPALSAALELRVEASVVRIAAPTQATVETLLAWLKRPERRVHAIYGLGIQARHLRDQGLAELSRRASRPLGELLGAAQGSTERVHLLRGIANSGDPALLSAVRPLLADTDDVVRGAALEALRLMDAPEVDGIIAERLRSERSYETLRAAVNAAKVRTPSPPLIGGLSEAARRSEDSQTRYRATQLLASWLGQRPELRSVLRELAERDANDDVREVAARALAPS